MFIMHRYNITPFNPILFVMHTSFRTPPSSTLTVRHIILTLSNHTNNQVTINPLDTSTLSPDLHFEEVSLRDSISVNSRNRLEQVSSETKELQKGNVSDWHQPCEEAEVEVENLTGQQQKELQRENVIEEVDSSQHHQQMSKDQHLSQHSSQMMVERISSPSSIQPASSKSNIQQQQSKGQVVDLSDWTNEKYLSQLEQSHHSQIFIQQNTPNQSHDHSIEGQDCPKVEVQKDCSVDKVIHLQLVPITLNAEVTKEVQKRMLWIERVEERVQIEQMRDNRWDYERSIKSNIDQLKLK